MLIRKFNEKIRDDMRLKKLKVVDLAVGDDGSLTVKVQHADDKRFARFRFEDASSSDESFDYSNSAVVDVNVRRDRKVFQTTIYDCSSAVVASTEHDGTVTILGGAS